MHVAAPPTRVDGAPLTPRCPSAAGTASCDVSHTHGIQHESMLLAHAFQHAANWLQAHFKRAADAQGSQAAASGHVQQQSVCRVRMLHAGAGLAGMLRHHHLHRPHAHACALATAAEHACAHSPSCQTPLGHGPASAFLLLFLHNHNLLRGRAIAVARRRRARRHAAWRSIARSIARRGSIARGPVPRGLNVDLLRGVAAGRRVSRRTAVACWSASARGACQRRAQGACWNMCNATHQAVVEGTLTSLSVCFVF